MENTFKIVWNNEEEDGSLYGVSVVNNPANKFEFIQLSEQDEVKLQVEVPAKKKHLAGVVLVPNQKIPRYSEERGEYNVVFEADVIERLAHNVFIKGYHKNSWVNHKETNPVKSSVIVESWIVEDPDRDKAVALGMGVLPKGTWCIIMKLNDEEWDKYVESGKVKGFSIDSFLSLEKMLFSEESNNNNKKLKEIETMKNVFKDFIKFMSDREEMKEDVKMLSIPMKEGEALEVEALEVGMVVTRDGEVFPDSEFVFEGKTFETDEEGKIKEVDAEEELDASEDKKEEVDAEEDKELPKMDMTDEEAKKELFDLISKDKELESVLKTKYGKTDEESVQMAINMAEENKEVKSKFEILFSEERKAFEDSIEAKDKEILNLKEQLEETPNDTKVKAEIKMSARNTESTMEALNRITKNNK
jgi:hypothetical protein